jgi:hypothetical protein
MKNSFLGFIRPAGVEKIATEEAFHQEFTFTG